jgi:hypothetical protein
VNRAPKSNTHDETSRPLDMTKSLGDTTLPGAWRSENIQITDVVSKGLLLLRYFNGGADTTDTVRDRWRCENIQIAYASTEAFSSLRYFGNGTDSNTHMWSSFDPYSWLRVDST